MVWGAGFVRELGWIEKPDVANPQGPRCPGGGPPPPPLTANGVVAVRDTSPLNPPWLVKVRFVVLYWPCTTVREEGVGTMVKSAGPMVMEIVIVWDFVPPEEDTVTWYVPAGVPGKDVMVRMESALPNDGGVTTLLVMVASRKDAMVADTVDVIPTERSKPLVLVTVSVVLAVEP